MALSLVRENSSPALVTTRVHLTRRQWMVVIFLLAVSVRVVLAWLTYSPDHVFNGEAEKIARALALKGAFADPYAIPTGPTAHCGPFYPAVLSLVYLMFGTGTTATIIRIGLLILVNSIGCAVLPLTATALGLPLWCGVGAGMGAALIPMHRTAETFNAWDEPYAAMGLMAVLVLLTRWQALRAGRLGALLVFGCFTGFMLYLSAPLTSVFFGLGVTEILMSYREQRVWQEVRRWAVIGMVAALMLLPWTIRNRNQLGSWIFARSSFGLMFQLSNTDGAGLLGYTAKYPGYNVAEAERLRDLGEIAYNQEMLQTAERWIQAHRGEFTVLTVERFVSFWSGWWGNPETAVVLTLITMLAVFGAWFMWRDGQRQVLQVFLPVWICYPIVYYVVAYCPRYHIVMWWTVVLTAAYGAGRLAMNLASRRPEKVVSRL
jgi:hypothetical protein